jgi:sigma-B regulation protein RsbU (phosphoserine phosphatase)
MISELSATLEHRVTGARWWRFLFREHAAKPASIDPIPYRVPKLRDAEIAAVYYNLRRAGDFHEFVRVGKSGMLFALLDMAGRRAHTREILRAAQKTCREIAAHRFAGDDLNQTIAMTEPCYAMNRTILNGGIRACPGFLGCYNEDLGTICYVNAGHTPALVRDGEEITYLESTGLPLGFFAHVPQSASTCALPPGGALLLVSRGIVEAEYHGEEFGLDGAAQSFLHASRLGADDLCLAILGAAENFMQVPPTHNDLTALALVRR